tara:strand:- start:1718 stop:2389 length:672 start_codon:yes stop_codon:yes gene_type:complete
MKLTNQQIEYVSDYIESKDILWYELQVELTDHMVTSMEEFWAKDPDLTFHQVKHYAEDKFGRNGFKAIEKERMQILKKEYRSAQWKMIASYLKFPKIIASILAVYLIYQGAFYFDNITVYVRILFGTLMSLSLLSILNWYRFKKIDGKRFLALESAYIMNNSALMLSFYPFILAKEFRENFETNHLLFVPFCCAVVLGFLLVYTGRHLTNKLVLDIKKQYQLS